MKTLTTLILIVGITALTAEAQSKDSEEVAAAVEKLRAAMVSGDRASLEALAADEISYGHSTGLIEDKAAFVEAIASGNNDFTTINLSEQMVRIVGNIAIVRHKLQGEILNKDKVASPINLNVLLIWQKQKGGWKLLARQAAKIV